LKPYKYPWKIRVRGEKRERRKNNIEKGTLNVKVQEPNTIFPQL